MFRDEKLELKVGLFIGAGIFLMFLIVFSISDFYFFKEGYEVNVVFDFVNGIKKSAPIRFAGVNVGEVKDIVVFYDEEVSRTRVNLLLKITGDTRIEEDAVARINTLGLLGEQYLEITPGRSKNFLIEGGVIQGKDPVNMGLQMEKMTEFADHASSLIRRISEGQGTIGKLLTEETIYRDLETIIARLRAGEGTIGKLLVQEDVYDNIEDLTSDIKANPWKLLRVTTDRSRQSEERSRGTVISPRR